MNWLGDQYQATVLRGIVETASGAGANLLCFIGGQLPVGGPGTGGQHRIYDLCNNRNVDALVVLGNTLSHGVGERALGDYCERFRPLRLCNLGVALPKFPSVTVDNDFGMRALCEHAVRVHGATRMAFVRGPMASAEADLRLAAYRAVLQEAGLPFDEQLVITGNFTSRSGQDAVQKLCDLPGMKLAELDAIIASNDAMALGVLNGLEQRNITVPGQLAVFGFDDTEDARFTEPPLTTVRQPLEKLGQTSLRSVLEWLQHGKPPANVELPTELVIRRSCGCSRPAEGAKPSSAAERNLNFEAGLLMQRERIMDALTRSSRGSFGGGGADWPGRLLTALVADLAHPEPLALTSAFEGLLARLVARGTDLNVCDDVLSVLRAQTVPLLRSDRARSERAEHVFHLCRLATSQAMQRALMRERVQVGRRSRDVNAACNALSASFDLVELRTRALASLPALGIQSCLLVLYGTAPDQLSGRLLFGYDASGKIYGPGSSIDGNSLLPAELVQSADRGISFAVMPLVVGSQNLGHVLMQLDLEAAYAYGPIAEAFSVGVHGSHLSGKTQSPRTEVHV
jgi:DNA-binding LacI/PurR family transcriptional regulator